MLAGNSSSCFCSWKFEGLNLPNEARSQIWDWDLNIWNNKSHLSLYLINSISIFLVIWTYKKTHMHDQMAFTHGIIYIPMKHGMFVEFFWSNDISLVRRLTVGSARALPPVNLPTWEMTIGPQKFQTYLVYILNVNSPCCNAHLVEHKSSILLWCKVL